MSTITPVRSSTVAPVARSRFRAWLGEIVVDDDHGRRGPGLARTRARGALLFRGSVRLARVRALPPLACLRLARRRAGWDDPLPAGQARELEELPLAEHRRRGERLAALRDRRGDVVAERPDEPGELGQVAFVLLVRLPRELDADEDGGRPSGGRRGRRRPLHELRPDGAAGSGGGGTLAEVAGARSTGSVTTKTAPCGVLSSIVTRPSCASTRRFTIERPRPVPPYSRVDEESTW